VDAGLRRHDGNRRHDGKRGQNGSCTAMKPAAFAYVRAASVGQAIELLAAEPDARLLAGGQSLGPMLNLRLARPTRLIDIKRAPELRVLEADSQHLRLGACWTHAEIEDGTIEDPTNGLLPHVARGIAYRAVRNRGTVGGSLAHADPAADWLATMAVLGAAIIVQGRGGARRCAASAFVQGPFATALGPAELIVAVEVPRLSAGARWGYHKVCRKTGEFARAIGAAVLDGRNGVARVVCGATGGAPLELPCTAARLAEAGVAAASEIVADEIAALRRAAPWQVHAVAVRRALAQLAASGEVTPEHQAGPVAGTA
jgi:aerobic carbon-monoxide dehydrogenase medium subunit